MWQVIGHSKAVSLLQRSLEKGSLAHACLFLGPPHVGKMTLAVNLAQAVNCLSDDLPCGECNSCQRIKQQKHADIQFIGLTNASEQDESRKKTEISIEQIRQIQHSANLPPFEGRHKVFIIDGAEFLSIEAANCLLKTLEEPFEKVLFILLAEDINPIPETIISRCQQLELIPLSVYEVEQELINHWDVEEYRAGLLARLCKGRIGWAISASQDGELLKRYYEDRDHLLDILNNNYEERFNYAAQLARQFSQKRRDTLDLLKFWLDLWRDLMLIKVGFRESIINIDLEERMGHIVEEIELYDIRNFIKNIQRAVQNLRYNVNPRLVFEVLMMDIPVRKRERIGSKV